MSDRSHRDVVEDQQAAIAEAVKLGLSESFLRFVLERMEDETTPGRHPSIGAMRACLEELKIADRRLKRAQTALGTPDLERVGIYPWRASLGQIIGAVEGKIGWYESALRARGPRARRPRGDGVTWLLVGLSEYVRATTGQPRWPLVLRLVGPFVGKIESEALRVRVNQYEPPERQRILRGLEQDFRTISSPADPAR